MEAINYKRMKTEEAARNFDTVQITDDYDVAMQNAQGTYGAKSFFKAVKDFFKGISALGTLASGSRLPVTDSNGNVTYTTMNDVNNYVVNNALTDYVGKGKTIYPTEVAVNLNDINEVFKKAKLVSKNTQNLPTSLPTLSASAYGYVETVPLINDNNARVKQELYISDNPDGNAWQQFHYIRFRVDGVWLGWRSIVTNVDLNNALANYTSFFNKNISQIGNADDLPEGFYTANAITNGYSGWATYFTIKINNDPNYMIQIYISQIGNLRFRRKNNGVWGTWESLT